MQTQARQPKKMETQRDAAYHIHFTSESLHDLTSPVNQMCSLADLIIKRYGGQLDDEADTLFGFFKASAQRLQILLGGLRTFIQVTTSSNPYELCEGDALLAASLAPIEQEIRGSGATVTHDHLPELFCDPVQMTYVFSNLIENAVKFRGERAPEIHISSASQQDLWVLAIRDNGLGIPEQQKERVFGMFHRVNNDMISGAGVGLAVAKRIMDLHRGRIWVESELGRGSTFFLALPKSHN
jgi:chemotaxis family two-component system sensor kinase Cph1